MLTPWFERPAWLWLLPVAAILLFALEVGAGRLAGRRAARLGVQAQRHRSAGLVFAVAFALLVTAAAGPRWGAASRIATATGHDLAVVLDVSRSMNARDVLPDRLGRATELIAELLSDLERRGGDRVAVVVFAARPVTLVPLTYDLAHVRTALADLRPAEMPDLRDPAAASGTRLGTAVRQALGALGDGGSVLVLSDGDDPARDGEWLRGAEAATAAGVPVYVIGIGDPARDSPVPGARLDGVDATTRLQEGPLRELAARTGGRYLAAGTARADLAGFARSAMTGPTHEGDDAAVARPPARPAPFLAAGLLLATLGLVGWPRRRAVVGTAALVAVAAAPIDDWLRRGNAELAAGRPDAALAWYARAAERTPDPGQVAFNQGVAYAALGRHRDAELHFRRTLSDAVGERRAMALYNLGTSLVRRCAGRERTALRDAVGAFEQALPHAGGSLADDVRVNLEAARKLLAAAPAEEPGRGPAPEEPAGAKPGGDTDAPPATGGEAPKGAAAGKARPAAGGASGRETVNKAPPGVGNLPPLPDSDVVERIPPQDLDAYLDRTAERIAAARKARLRARPPAGPTRYPDW